MKYKNYFGIGVAGNFTGHLEQANEAKDFTAIEVTEEIQPKAIFPFYFPNLEGHFLSTYPVSSSNIILPNAPYDVQIEPEVALICNVTYKNNQISQLKPISFGAYNDCSIRRPDAKKISHKKNWGQSSKGLSNQLLELDSFTKDGKHNRYSISSFHKTNGKIYQYGETSRVASYSYINEKLLNWIIDRLNNQTDIRSLQKNVDKDFVKANISQFATMRSNLVTGGGLTKEIKSFLTDGLISDFSSRENLYQNTYHMDLLDESIKTYIHKRLPDDHYTNPDTKDLNILNTFHPDAEQFSFATKAKSYMTRLMNNTALPKMGLILDDALYSLSNLEDTTFKIAPFGFGVIKIPKEDIQIYSEYQGGFRFKVESSQSDLFHYSVLDFNGEAIRLAGVLSTENPNISIISFQVLDSDKDAYLFISNGAQVEASPFIVLQKEGVCLDGELPTPSRPIRCVPCNVENAGEVTSAGTCVYSPQDIRRTLASDGLTDATSRCNSVVQQGIGSSHLQTFTSSIEWKCNGQHRTTGVTRRVLFRCIPQGIGTTGIPTIISDDTFNTSPSVPTCN